MSPRPTTLAPLLLSPLLAVALATAPAAAQAPCGSCPSCIMLVGTNGAVADPVGNFCVTAVNPTDCAPLPGALIVVDFSACPGVKLCSIQPDPTMTVNCATRTVSKMADATGTACFDIVGGAIVAAGVPCPPPGCATISALVGTSLVPLCHPLVSTPDLDNMGGVNPTDLSIWLSIYFSGQYCQLADYDCSGTLSPTDLSKWLSIFFAGGSVAGCPVSCP